MSNPNPAGSGSAGTPPAQPRAPIAERLLNLSFEKPVEAIGALALVLAGLHTVFYGAGLIALSNREQLLGLATPLTYSTQVALQTSLHVLWSLPWSMISAPFDLTLGRWAILALTLPLFLHGLWHCRSRWRGYGRLGYLLGHVVVILICLIGIRCLTAAVLPALAEDQPAPRFASEVDLSWPGQARAEVVTWLVNEKPGHETHRQALFGLTGWLIVFFVGITAHGRHAWRAADRGRVLPWLGGVYLLLALASLPQVPRAYALMQWGISYPRVHDGSHVGGGCCTYDVSAGGLPTTTLHVGKTCKFAGFRSWVPEKNDLLVGVREVIKNDCP